MTKLDFSKMEGHTPGSWANPVSWIEIDKPMFIEAAGCPFIDDVSDKVFSAVLPTNRKDRMAMIVSDGVNISFYLSEGSEEIKGGCNG